MAGTYRDEPGGRLVPENDAAKWLCSLLLRVWL